MKGSGIDSGDFDYPNFVCNECQAHNKNATAYYDDWGNWVVDCQACDVTFAKGNIHDRDE
jgi:hypothetical protein